MTSTNTKQCKDCKEYLPINAFQKADRNGLNVRCKACSKHRYDKRDPHKMFSYIFATQVTRSALKGYPAPAYSLDDLKAWGDQHPRIGDIWQAYVASGYITALRPIIFLKDETKPYSLDNLDLGVVAARLPDDQRPVAAYLLDGSLHKAYVSLRDAARDVNGKMWGITSVADRLLTSDGNGGQSVPKSYRGYKWRWL